MIVFHIDAGHGGKDHGTTEGGLIEKEITLQVAEKLAARIEAHPGAVAILTRDGDYDLSTAARGALSKKGGADFVISLHVNALPGFPKQDGLMCFHWPENKIGKLVAEKICACSPDELHHSRPCWPTSRHDWRRDAHSVLRVHKATAVLVEMGFSTNEGDAVYLQTRQGQAAIVDAILSGLGLVAPGIDSTPEEPAPDLDPAPVELAEYIPPEEPPKKRKRKAAKSKSPGTSQDPED